MLEQRLDLVRRQVQELGGEPEDVAGTQPRRVLVAAGRVARPGSQVAETAGRNVAAVGASAIGMTAPSASAQTGFSGFP
jgi:hypothetical protein